MLRPRMMFERSPKIFIIVKLDSRAVTRFAAVRAILVGIDFHRRGREGQNLAFAVGMRIADADGR